MRVISQSETEGTKHLMLNIHIIQTTQSMIKANVKLKFDDSVQISGQNEVHK